MKGLSVGFGKGFLGLVCKPMKGTIDLVTKTTKGLSNTPRTVYVSISQLARKVPKKKKEAKNPNEPLENSNLDETDQDLVDPEDDILLGEEDGENIYISRKALKSKI